VASADRFFILVSSGELVISMSESSHSEADGCGLLSYVRLTPSVALVIAEGMAAKEETVTEGTEVEDPRAADGRRDVAEDAAVAAGRRLEVGFEEPVAVRGSAGVERVFGRGLGLVGFPTTDIDTGASGSPVVSTVVRLTFFILFPFFFAALSSSFFKAISACSYRAKSRSSNFLKSLLS
jgi:hypothetical protein